MSDYVTAKEMAKLVGLSEATVYNRLINAGIISRHKDGKRGYQILEKKREYCKIMYRDGRYRLLFHFEEIRHYTAGMYRRCQK